MEAIIFCGIQASGKSTYFQQHFFHTHVRISMDLLRTRHREKRFMELCLQSGQRFVIDNTNPSAEERSRYILPAKQARFRVICYYFESPLAEAIRRNASRSGKARIPDKGIGGTYKRLEIPSLAEGYDAIYKVQLRPDNQYTVMLVAEREENE